MEDFKEGEGDVLPVIPENEPDLLHKESEQFSDRIIVSRQNDQRRHPIFRALPVRQIILIMYKTLSSSQYLEHFQLIGLGNTLLSLLRQLQKLQNPDDEVAGSSTANPQEQDEQFKTYTDILEMICKRLNAYNSPDEKKKDIKRFLDSVWELHENGILNLNKTSIPATIVTALPSQLENVLESCIIPDQQKSMSPLPLIPLCSCKPENFMKVMELLQLKYSTCQKSRGQMLSFGKEFQKLLLKKLDSEYTNLFPTAFHPLLHFVREISVYPSLLQNEAAIQQILSLVNTIFYQSELFRFKQSNIIFLLLTIPNLSFLTVFNRACNSNLWLKRAMSKEEMILLKK